MSIVNCCPKCGSDLPTAETEGLCPKCLLGAGLESRVNPQGPFGQNELGATTAQKGSFQPPKPAEIAPYFPQLDINELLGHGAMGAVYKARQKKLDRLVALKIIRPESVDDPAFAERFNREARMLARLDHPNIVAVHDFGEAGGLYYFIMEYVDGANLRQLIGGQALKPELALAVVPQICQALQFAHDAGVVHRDIKPENILLDRKGRVKIADFGLAKLMTTSPEDITLTGTHQVMGTPRYMAPEQMEGSHRVDHRADIYSLGIVFYEMLTGEVPLGHFEPPSARVRVDVRLDEVILRSLAREPERRYQRASQVKTDIEMISDDLVGSFFSTDPAGDSPEKNSTGVTPKMNQPPVIRKVQAMNSAPKTLTEVRAAVMKPALALIVVGSLSILVQIALFFWLFWWWIEFHRIASPNIVGWIVLHLMVVVLAATIWMIYGAVSLLNLGSLRDAQASAIAALLPLPGILIGLPFGIWALAILSRPDVCSRFQLQTANRSLWKNAGQILVWVLFILITIAMFSSLLRYNPLSM